VIIQPKSDGTIVIIIGDSGPTLSFEESGLGDDLLATGASKKRLTSQKLPKGRAGSRLDYALSKAVLCMMGGGLSVLTEVPAALHAELQVEHDSRSAQAHPAAGRRLREGDLQENPIIALSALGRCTQLFELQLKLEVDRSPSATVSVSRDADSRSFMQSGSFNLLESDGFPMSDKVNTVVTGQDESEVL